MTAERPDSSTDLITCVAQYENLLWAWNKAKSAYRVGDIWFDTLELADFEANLRSKLTEIQESILRGTYQLTPLKPLPYPKGSKELEDGSIEQKVRQTFYIAVRDQVTWLAVVNIIGPELDFEMPFWSYGNRLYRSTWYEEDEQEGQLVKKLKTGWYRSSVRNIYRVWKQSWPLFRHTISLTIKKMSNMPEDDYSESEKEMEENNSNLPENFAAKYLESGYWNGRNGKVTQLYWAGIDFEKFYPTVKIESIVKNIILFHPKAEKDSSFKQLLNQLTTFKIDLDDTWTGEDIKDINLKIDGDSIFKGIPTGLYVAGFLANVALLEVDKKVAEKLTSNRNIAHFRYVDDHVILAYDFQQLCQWIDEYEGLIQESDIGTKINIEKTEPDNLAKYLQFCPNCPNDHGECNFERSAKKACELDPNFPSPLVTQTLAKVSAIADCDVDFLTEHEEQQLIADLEHLLITDFPEHELRSDTRISFAASMLSSIMQRKRIDYSSIYDTRQKILHLTREFVAIKKEDKEIEDHCKHLVSKYVFNNTQAPDLSFPAAHSHIEAANQKIKDIKELHHTLQQQDEAIQKRDLAQKRHIFKLLIKATKENHDKIKLWWRLIDYCINTGISYDYNSHNSLIDIFEAIKAVYDSKKSHKLSNDFLVSQFVLVLSDRLTNALYAIINSDDVIRKENPRRFIQACLNDDLLNLIFEEERVSRMEYYTKSFDYLRLSLGTARYLDERTYSLTDYGLIDWRDRPSEWCANHNIELDKYLAYLLYRLNDKSSTESIFQWKTMAQNSSNPDFFLEPFDSIIEKSEVATNGMITIYEWIRRCEAKDADPNYVYDPRLSEWMALKIVAQLIDCNEKENNAEAFLTDGTISPDLKIHPKNYMIPAEWIEKEAVKNWGYYRTLDFDKIIYVGGETAISDPRYTPKGLSSTYKLDEGDFTAIYGYAVILCQLICHNVRFPWIWNMDDKNIEYSSYIFANTKNISLSSYTKAILSACTLSRSRESFNIKQIFDELSLLDKGVSEDTNNDPPQIATLSKLKEYIDTAIAELEKLQTSVTDDKPRQLIPIRLEGITKHQPF